DPVGPRGRCLAGRDRAARHSASGRRPGESRTAAPRLTAAPGRAMDGLWSIRHGRAAHAATCWPDDVPLRRAGPTCATGIRESCVQVPLKSVSSFLNHPDPRQARWILNLSDIAALIYAGTHTFDVWGIPGDRPPDHHGWEWIKSQHCQNL